jgi:GNAT superfamily N-acetyltransferase
MRIYDPRPTMASMAGIIVRDARPGDGEALVRLHEDMAAYYADLAPQHFHAPDLDGLAQDLDDALGSPQEHELHLVAEDDGQVIGALTATLLAPADGAERQITPDLGVTRLRIDYLATAANHRRGGVGTRLAEAAEAWGRRHGATLAETSTYQASPLSMPFWTERMSFEIRSVNLRKAL